MDSITFKRTGHILLNNGIVGVCDFLKKAQEEGKFGFDFTYKLSEESLVIESDQLFSLLEELYYWMGCEVYDTYTLKQQENADKLQECNVYYDEEKEKFVAFPKMNTYGLTELLTNNAQGITRHENATTTVKKLAKENPMRMQQFNDFFEKHKLKLLSKLYINERYTKITRLIEPRAAYFETGDEQCYLTGESFKKLVDATNISPFFSGFANFNSRFSGTDKKISWKALYLSRFAPAHAFYHYPNKLRETLHIYLLSSNSLTNLNRILHLVELKKDPIALKSEEFVSNIKTDSLDTKEVFTEQYEVAFILIYNFYKKAISNYGNISESDTDNDLFANIFNDFPPFTILCTKADALGNTLRPNDFSTIDKLRSIIRTLHGLEKNGVLFSRLLPSLKLIKPSAKNSNNSFRLERVLRDNILERFLQKRTVLDHIEHLYYRCFTYLCADEYVGYKDYKQIFNFLQHYESNINDMNEELQQQAIKLGQQIGIKMKSHDESVNEKANAKKGRSDLITLRKARTLKQFLDELIKVDFKYGLLIKEELATKINESNYYTIKQFLIIGALNVLNPAITSYTKTNKNN